MPLLLLENWKAYDQNLNLADQHAKNLGQAAAKHPQVESSKLSERPSYVENWIHRAKFKTLNVSSFFK